MRLHGYWRSGATYRLRCALNLKELRYDYTPVNLAAGEQHEDAYSAKNPLGLVPALELAGGPVLTNSEAIIDFLEESHPQPTLLPENKLERARVRAFCATIGADTQPLGNLRVLKYLKSEFEADDVAIANWVNTWIAKTFDVLEATAREAGTEFAFGDAPGLAEVYLIPQLYTARRFGLDLAPYPTLAHIGDACDRLDPFILAHPDNQPDAPGA